MMMTMKYQRGTAFEVFLMNERSVPLDHGCQVFMQQSLMTFIYGMLLLAMTSEEMLLALFHYLLDLALLMSPVNETVTRTSSGPELRRGASGCREEGG